MRKLLASLALAFIFLSCDNGNVDTDANPFVGSWEKIDMTNVCLVYTKTVATCYINDSINWTGTYVYDDTHITINLDQELSSTSMIDTYGETFINEYKFENGLLLLWSPSLNTFRRITNNS
jgi:hypothetical protein